MSTKPKRVIIGITGASGAIYGIRLMEVLSANDGVETHLVISPPGARIIELETDRDPAAVSKLADFCYDINDLEAPIASGSFPRDGMIILPCTVKTMAAVASSFTDNLITRAADVTLKERRLLILGVRETPLHQGHLRHLLHLAEMGAVILPPIPAFYHRPRDIDDIVNHTVGRALNLLSIENKLVSPWGSAYSPPEEE